MNGIDMLTENANGVNALSIYDLPIAGESPLGQLLASDEDIGRYTDFMTVGNFDSDPDMEVALIKTYRRSGHILLVYDLPGTASGDLGTLIAYDLNIGLNIIALSADNFDADDEDEVIDKRGKTVQEI